ncbi:MAG: PAS domain S-box protein, partial [Desulfobacteraceae bacterium]|nr:PAS domain S-box protein [Desulfobacteraceae bacterium]
DMVDFNILNDPECERAGLTSGFKKVLQNIECSIPPSKYAPKESGFPGGSIRWINSKMYPIKDQHGKIKNIILVLEDITAQKNAEEVLQKSHNEIELKMQDRIAERVKAQDALQESEKQLNTLLNATSNIAFLAESDGTFLAVNKALVKILGVEKEELINHSLFEFFPKEDAEKRRHKLQKIIESKNSFQWNDARAGRYFDNSVYPIFDGKGNVKQVAIFARDITLQMKADETLRRYEHIISATNDHMSFLDRNYTYLAVNDAYLITHKKERSQIIGHTVADILGDDIFEQFVKEKLDRCLSGEEIHYQDWFDFPGLGRRYMDVVYYPYTGSDGIISGVVVSSHDITDRKLAEDMLIEKTMYLNNILRSATEYAIATTDLNFCITYYNPLAEKFFGYTADEVIGKTVQEMHTREHVDSKRFDKAIEIIRTQGEYCYRVKQETDTGTRYLDSRVSGIYDNASKLVGFALFSHDITTSIKAEQELKYSKLQLEAVFNNLDSMIYITDMDSCEVLYMNDYMKKTFGKDFTGNICWKSFHENRHGPCDFCTNDKLIDANGNPKEPYVWEFHSQTLNRWYELHDQAIPWTDGKLVRMEIALDITERKLSEVAVKRREQYLKALNSASQLLLIPTDTPPLQKIVDLIGPVSQASRAYIFINHHSADGNLLTSQKAEWCTKGITPEINNPDLQNMSYDALVPRLKETLQQGDFYKGCVADFPDNEREILEPQGILSILIIPIMLDDEFIGFIGFDNCVFAYEWDSVDLTFLGTAAVGVGQAIKRRHTENTIRSSLDEKVVLLREIHHRVKNNMQVIVSLLRMHSRRIKDANLGKVFEDCRDRINAMSLIHESLYQSDNLAQIDFKVYIKKLCQNLGQAYGASGKGISLAVGECDVALDMDQGIAIGMVIVELISNAFKHAFPTGKGGNVSINLSELDTENVKLIIKDNGQGMPPQIDIMNSPSLGLRLAVSAVTLELGGSIEIDRDKGTQFTICFKYKRK